HLDSGTQTAKIRCPWSRRGAVGFRALRGVRRNRTGLGSPSPLAGEGGFERSEKPGEGFFSLGKAHRLPRGERGKGKGERGRGKGEGGKGPLAPARPTTGSATARAGRPARP